LATNTLLTAGSVGAALNIPFWCDVAGRV